MRAACWPSATRCWNLAGDRAVGRRAAARPVSALGGDEPRRLCAGRRGADTIFWGWFESPFGRRLSWGTDKGICGMAFSAETGEAAALEDLVGALARGALRGRPDDAAALGAERLWRHDTRQQRDPAVFLIGAPFQIKVWEALLQIPTGHVTTIPRSRGGGPSARGARRGHRGGPQPDQLADPLPPRAAQDRGAGGVSLGAAGQARHAGLGVGPPPMPKKGLRAAS